MNPISRTTFTGLMLTLLAAAALWLVMHALFAGRKRELATRQAEAVTARERDWASEDAQHALALRDAATERSHRQASELELALGGPAAAAAKDPKLSIGEAIQKVARACAPAGSLVNVRVDRFTEFTAVVVLPRRLPRSTLGETARCIMTHCSEHLDRLQFALEGSIIAELDRVAIESVADWPSVSTARVERLLSEAELTDSPTYAQSNPDQSSPAKDEPQNLSEEARTQLRATESFTKAMEEARLKLNSALKLQEQALDLSDVRSARDLQSKAALLDQAAALSAQAKAALEDPAGVYQRILQAANLDELYIRTAIRTVSSRHGASAQAVATVFRTLSDRTASAGAFVVTMASHFGDWSYSAATQQMQFESPAAHRDFKQVKDRIERDGAALESSIQAWVALEREKAKTP